MDSPSKESRNSSETASASNAASAAATSASAQPMVNGTTDSGASPTSAESVLDKIRELGIDFFSEDFEGETKASTLCLSCETTTEQTETMLDLSVPITENMETHDMDESFIQVSHAMNNFPFYRILIRSVIPYDFRRIYVSQRNDFKATINSDVRNVQVTQKRFDKYPIRDCLVYW